jgi:glycosyltransferase involved in cell wall biosynthesis
VRKDPLAGVRAFRAAFDADNRNVRMIIKLRNVDRTHWSNIDGYWDDLEAEVNADPRIEFLIGDLTDDEYWTLLATCDTFVSLHRGEGFCYPVADAMMLGKPVVVANYSGTTDFCTEQTAFLVDVDIVPTPPAHMRSTAPIGNWGIPRLDSAAAAMRQAVAQRAEAAARAAAGQNLVLEQYDFLRWRAALLSRLAPYLATRLQASGRLTLSSMASPMPGNAD